MSEIDPKLSRLYREASAEGPPAALDAAILAAAHEQVAKPRRRARASWVRWMAPASALATLVVAVSLAFLVEREQPGNIDETVIHKVSPRPERAPPARPAESANMKAADSAAPAAAAKKEAVAAPAATVPAQVRPPAAAAPAPRNTEPAPPAAQAFPADSRAKQAESKAAEPRAAESRVMRESNAAGDAAPGAYAPAAPAAAGRIAPMRQQAAPRSPQAWLEEIGRLKREGREKEAAEQLAEFRKAYPAYAVPENLLK